MKNFVLGGIVFPAGEDPFEGKALSKEQRSKLLDKLDDLERRGIVKRSKPEPKSSKSDDGSGKPSKQEGAKAEKPKDAKPAKKPRR